MYNFLTRILNHQARVKAALCCDDEMGHVPHNNFNTNYFVSCNNVGMSDSLARSIFT